MDSKTESIANSSIYHELAADMDGFNAFVSQTKQRELEATQRTTKKQGQTTKISKMTLAEVQEQEREEESEMRVLR